MDWDVDWDTQTWTETPTLDVSELAVEHAQQLFDALLSPSR